MIQFQLFGDDNIHDRYIQLVAVPRVGDQVVVDLTYRVTRVVFFADEQIITLWLEQSA